MTQLLFWHICPTEKTEKNRAKGEIEKLVPTD